MSDSPETKILLIQNFTNINHPLIRARNDQDCIDINGQPVPLLHTSQSTYALQALNIEEPGKTIVIVDDPKAQEHHYPRLIQILRTTLRDRNNDLLIGFITNKKPLIPRYPTIDRSTLESDPVAALLPILRVYQKTRQRQNLSDTIQTPSPTTKSKPTSTIKPQTPPPFHHPLPRFKPHPSPFYFKSRQSPTTTKPTQPA